MNLTTLSTITGLITIAGGGWWAATTLADKADKDAVMIVAVKAEIGISEHINYLSTEIATLEVKLKHNKATEYDKDRLQTLRKKREALETTQRLK